MADFPVFGGLFGAREKIPSKARERRPRVIRAPYDPCSTGSGRWIPAAGSSTPLGDEVFTRSSRMRATGKSA